MINDENMRINILELMSYYYTSGAADGGRSGRQFHLHFCSFLLDLHFLPPLLLGLKVFVVAC